MKKRYKKSISIMNIISPILVITIFLLVLFFMLNICKSISEIGNCKYYSENYNLNVVLEGKLFLGKYCYIIANDGTKILSRDFNIAMVKDFDKVGGTIK